MIQELNFITKKSKVCYNTEIYISILLLNFNKNPSFAGLEIWKMNCKVTIKVK